MERNDMIAKLCVRSEGMHICGHVPTRFVTVGGPIEKYDDAELALLVAFTEERQAAYHARCGGAKLDWGDNFICFDKEVDGRRVRWGRKRYSWREGRMHSASLPEAIATFRKDSYRDEVIGDLWMLSSGDLVEVVKRLPYDRENGGRLECRRLTDNAIILYDQHTVGGVAIHDRTLDGLGDKMRMAMKHRIANQPDASEEELAAAIAATTDSNDPTALTAMWAARVPSWDEREALLRKSN